jgi:hypothetical protein
MISYKKIAYLPLPKISYIAYHHLVHYKRAYWIILCMFQIVGCFDFSRFINIITHLDMHLNKIKTIYIQFKMKRVLKNGQ